LKIAAIKILQSQKLFQVFGTLFNWLFARASPKMQRIWGTKVLRHLQLL